MPQRVLPVPELAFKVDNLGSSSARFFRRTTPARPSRRWLLCLARGRGPQSERHFAVAASTVVTGSEQPTRPDVHPAMADHLTTARLKHDIDRGRAGDKVAI